MKNLFVILLVVLFLVALYLYIAPPPIHPTYTGQLHVALFVPVYETLYYVDGIGLFGENLMTNSYQMRLSCIIWPGQFYFMKGDYVIGRYCQGVR